jgi:hypothetical protein
VPKIRTSLSTLLAVSPLMRSILTDLLPPDYCPCFVSLPATEEVLQVVRDILTTGTVVGDHVNEIEEVRQVLGMLGVEALIVSYQLESIQVGQVFERNIKEELSTEGPEISLEDEKVKIEPEVIVKIEDKENTNDDASEGSNTFSEFSLSLKNPYFSVPNKTSSYCTLCSQKFTSRNLLRRHIEFVHTKEISSNICPQNAKCNLRPQKFDEKHKLDQHFQSNHNYSKFECHLCPQKFAKKQGLVRHIKSVHDLIRIQCNLCPLTFTQKKGLNVHIRSVHDQIRFHCGLCSKKFTQKGHLTRHTKLFHDQNI